MDTYRVGAAHMDMLVCGVCKQTKEKYMFDSRNRRYAGLCRECRRESVTTYRNTRDGYFRHLLGRVGRHTKSRDQRRVVISDKDLQGVWEKQGGKCAITGMDMQHEYKWDGRRAPLSAAMDLIDTNAEYSPGNIQLVCQFVHDMKGRTPLGRFLADCKVIVDRTSPATDVAIGSPSDAGSTSMGEEIHVGRWADEVV
eukprot:jgi/Mesvir1/6629/Mv16280-RA.1